MIGQELKTIVRQLYGGQSLRIRAEKPKWGQVGLWAFVDANLCSLKAHSPT